MEDRQQVGDDPVAGAEFFGRLGGSQRARFVVELPVGLGQRRPYVRVAGIELDGGLEILAGSGQLVLLERGQTPTQQIFDLFGVGRGQ